MASDQVQGVNGCLDHGALRGDINFERGDMLEECRLTVG